ncbi:MAG: ABC transporter substrate-binding protein [Acidimicrobiia bacterium]
MRAHRTRRLVFLATACLVAVAACGGDDGDTDASSAGSAESTADVSGAAGETTVAESADGASVDSADGTTPTTAAAGETSEGSSGDAEVDTNAVLKIGIGRQNTTFDPHRAPTTFEEQQLDLVYDRLLRRLPDGTVAPELAESWEFTPEGLVLSIREGVQFHDGSVLDAEVVKLNLDRARTLEDSAVKNDFVRVTDVQVIDPKTVLLVMPETDVTILTVLSTRGGAIAARAGIEADTLATEPIGAGPFTLVDFVPDASETFQRFDGYWNPDIAKVAGIEVSVLPDPTARLNAFQSGVVDMVQLEPTQVPEAEAVGLRLETANLQTVIGIQINPDNVPAFADPRVRQAMNYAIDREALVDGFLQGLGEPTVQVFAQTIAFDPNLGDLYPYDPEKAKQLLAEAGYPDGFEFTLDHGSTPSAEEVDAVVGLLAAVGITANAQELPGNETVVKMWTEKSGEGMITPWNTLWDPSLNFGQFLPDHPRNPANLVNDEVVALWQQSLGEQDQAKRSEILQQASRLVAEEPLSVIPLYSTTATWALSDRVTGFSLPANNFWVFRGVGLTA